MHQKTIQVVVQVFWFFLVPWNRCPNQKAEQIKAEFLMFIEHIRLKASSDSF